ADVVHESNWELEDFPVEEQNATLATVTPTKSQITNLNPVRLACGMMREPFDSAAKPFRTCLHIPAPEMFLRRAGIPAKHEPCAIELERMLLLLHHLESEATPQVTECLAGNVFRGAHLWRSFLLQGQLAMHPEQLLVCPTGKH